jgi:hypothetical protein
MRADLFVVASKLPYESDKRDRILRLFNCYSLATVMLRLQHEEPELRREHEQQIEAILTEPDSLEPRY